MIAAAPGVLLFLLDDEGVVFDAARQLVFALNTMGTAIWCLMEQRLDRAGIEAALRGLFGLEEATAGAFVRVALEDWTARGLLAGSPPEVPAPAADTAGDAAPAPAGERLPGYPDPAPVFATKRHYLFRGRALTLRCTDAAQDALVHPVLAHLAASAPAPAAGAACPIDIIATPEGIVVYRDGIARGRCAGLGELAPLAKATVWRTGLGGDDYLLNLHAGVVAGPAGAVLLPAPPGSGKSTLTAALVRSGLDYFSDEVALLAADDLAVMAFPLAMCIKLTGLAAMQALYPGSDALPVHTRVDGKRVVYLPLPRDRVPEPGARRQVAAIVFPRYDPGATSTIRPLARPEALARLMSQCVGVGPVLQAADIARLVAWIRGIPCFEAVYPDLPLVVAAIGRMVGAAPPDRLHD
ncbi:MAG: PqqD family peptide modification chaperone [Acetobacteraceae bacterium]